jgi:hypothetical protein
MLDVRTVRMHRGHQHEGAKREKRDNLHSDSPSKKSSERNATKVEVREMKYEAPWKALIVGSKTHP